MAQNWVQFQHGVSLSEFTRIYGTKAQCEAALERARWPEGLSGRTAVGASTRVFLLTGAGSGCARTAASRRPRVRGPCFTAAQLV
jgi:hypothetical protein